MVYNDDVIIQACPSNLAGRARKAGAIAPTRLGFGNRQFQSAYKPDQMGFLSQVSSAVSRSGQGYKLSKDDNPPEGADADDMEELDEESGSILFSLIGQLRIGMDLHKVTLPTFVLEPRSMLERVTDFLSHPDLIFGADRLEDPEDRFLAVLTYYMSGWHIKPKGVKKPYNPVLGEFFRCTYTYPNGTTGVYIAEQVSHHPPISAYYYVSPENNVLIYGDLRPKSKFLGNTAANIMGGTSHVVLLSRPEDGEYSITMPNMYARGILFGKMVLELGDHSEVVNENLQMSTNVEFKVKGYFTGSYNMIDGKVMHKGRQVGDISGKWSSKMEYRDSRTGRSRLLFDAHNAQVVQKQIPPIDQQMPNESQRLWLKVTEGIVAKDMNKATEAKSVIEDAQREDAQVRERQGITWKPKFFALHKDRYIPVLGSLPEEYRPAAAMQHFSKYSQ